MYCISCVLFWRQTLLLQWFSGLSCSSFCAWLTASVWIQARWLVQTSDTFCQGDYALRLISWAGEAGLMLFSLIWWVPTGEAATLPSWMPSCTGLQSDKTAYHAACTAARKASWSRVLITSIHGWRKRPATSAEHRNSRWTATQSIEDHLQWYWVCQCCRQVQSVLSWEGQTYPWRHHDCSFADCSLPTILFTAGGILDQNCPLAFLPVSINDVRKLLAVMLSKKSPLDVLLCSWHLCT